MILSAIKILIETIFFNQCNRIIFDSFRNIVESVFFLLKREVERKYDSDADEVLMETRTKGHAQAAQLRANEKLSHEEAWMINLGRNNDNVWLTGAREDAWYTGVHPRDCPGTL